MQVRVLRPQGTTYYLKAFGVDRPQLRFDYTKDFRDRLRRAQAWNKGNSLIYSLR